MQTTTFPTKIQIIIVDAFSFFLQNFAQIAALCLPFVFATSAFDFIFGAMYKGSPMSIMAPMMLNLLVYPIYTAALIHLMAQRARQASAKNSDLIMTAIQQWAPLFILKAIMVFLIGVGISLLLVPGIWIAVRLVFAEFYLVLFGMTPRAAIVKSFESTHKYFGLLLILLLMTYVPILVSGLTADHLVQMMTQNDFFRVLVGAAWSFLGLFVHVVLFRAFMQVVSEQSTKVVE
jgi:hypothetical protein